jgi:hypothetical protein
MCELVHSWLNELAKHTRQMRPATRQDWLTCVLIARGFLRQCRSAALLTVIKGLRKRLARLESAVRVLMCGPLKTQLLELSNQAEARWRPHRALLEEIADAELHFVVDQHEQQAGASVVARLQIERIELLVLAQKNTNGLTATVHAHLKKFTGTCRDPDKRIRRLEGQLRRHQQRPFDTTNAQDEREILAALQQLVRYGWWSVLGRSPLPAPSLSTPRRPRPNLPACS